jgi:2'-5' RNA ligase
MHISIVGSKMSLERIFIGVKLPTVYTNAVSQLYQTDPHCDRRLKNCRWVSEDSMHLTLTFIGEVSSERRALIQNELASVKFPLFSLQLKNRVSTFPAKAKKNIRVIHMPLYSSNSSDNESKIEEEKLSEELDGLKKDIDLIVERFSSPIEVDLTQVVRHEEEQVQVKKDRNDIMDRPLNASVIFVDNTIGETGKGKNYPKKKEIFHPHLTLARVKQYCQVQEVFDLINEMNSKIEDRCSGDFSFWNSMVFPVASFVLFRSHLTPKGSIYEVIQEYTCCDS